MRKVINSIVAYRRQQLRWAAKLEKLAEQFSDLGFKEFTQRMHQPKSEHPNTEDMVDLMAYLEAIEEPAKVMLIGSYQLGNVTGFDLQVSAHGQAAVVTAEFTWDDRQVWWTLTGGDVYDIAGKEDYWPGDQIAHILEEKAHQEKAAQD